MWAFLYGVFAGALCASLALIDHYTALAVPWYAWILVVLALALTGMSMEGAIGSRREREPRAAWMSLAVLGVPSAAFWAVALLTMSFGG